ncbi:protein of unknown function DUF421 [Desulfotomaculum nigrificans CO-1-SRB]|uniref:DUF421 domain-containing protein n=1 Tax=Desulfotomaculum nigrificans (strain DSM 14880 / VKM B-2319 / CO-1-SRB) TaxID=868595 RepID=F6B8P8_DESCC|nr:DUF421 domain-containing protein [Desulfotomaculum nigrificans]AEF94741.1 protein of unknown function DUF421 [Desulfotomaculum nigrificans CO-1-SRB]
MNDVWPHIWRTVVIYFAVLVIVRLMGKREIGQLSSFDFVVAIILAELAAIPMESHNIPIWHGIIPLVTLGILEVAFSYLTLINRPLRKILYGAPQIIIENGRLLKHEMRSSRYNLDDLLSQLREKGYPDIEDVEYAILEPSGRLSVIPKSQKRPVTPADLGISTPYEGLPTVLVMDGDVLEENLHQVNLSEAWLKEKLAERGLHPKSVLLATLNTKGQLLIDCQNDARARK